MAHAPSAYSVGKLYHGVIDDVIEGVRESFADEGVDEQVLAELRMLWESKLNATKAIEHETDLINSTDANAAGVNQNNGTNSSGSKGSNSRQNNTHQHQQNQSPNMAQQQQQQHQTQQHSSLAHTEYSNTSVPIQITIPRGPADPPGPQKTIQVHVPASLIHTNKLQEILSLPTVQAILTLPADQAALRLQEQVNATLRSELRSQTESVITRTMPMSHHQALSQSHQGSMGVPGNFAQIDGQGGIEDTSDEDDEDDDDDDDLDDDPDDKDEEKEDEQEEEGQNEEPLNSEDDVSEAGDSNDKLYEVDNVIVCQYDKITRTRNKWKFHLKDGIMNLNGKDFIFQKANGDAEW